MTWLHPVSDFWQGAPQHGDAPAYWYIGRCPRTQALLRLPRTPVAEAIAQGLMQELAADPQFSVEGKMYGILLVETPDHQLGVLKAFSGLLHGRAEQPGWVPPIPGRQQVALLETQTLETLASLKADMIALQRLPERACLLHQTHMYEQKLRALAQQHRQRKQARDRQRQALFNSDVDPEVLAQALTDLDRQSQQDGMERRRLKRDRDATLAPLRKKVAQADERLRQLKQQRKTLSRSLQTQMHAVYRLTNFAGETQTLQSLEPMGLPTGTGDCAAPKLLHWAASHQLTPLALAEFWWGPATIDKQPGQFYGACQERCQPIMGFLLSGLSCQSPVVSQLDGKIPILYEDDALLVVNKPSGLLSVPGRTRHLQDSVLSRLRCQRSAEAFLAAPHRLDKGTSGLLILAKTAQVHRLLNQQFARRQVKKIYEAVLSRPLAVERGFIDLPLWRDPRDRPKTCVDQEHGKPSLTEFRQLSSEATPRIQLIPRTGRTHQLRVHAAHPQGLNAPILGDPLYGETDRNGDSISRLHLHASEIKFSHPLRAKDLTFTTPSPF